MTLHATKYLRCTRGQFVPPGADLPTVKDQPPVLLRDLADQLGISFPALHQQVQAGRLPARPLSERRNSPLFVDAEVAEQVRVWHAANRFRPWPTFPLAAEGAS